MSKLELFLFGAPRLRRGGRATELGLRKAMALLAYLAVEGKPQARDSLAAMFWPEDETRAARANLRRTLHRLNRTLGTGVLSLDGDSVALSADAGLRLDVAAFRDAVAAHLSGAEATSSVDLARLTDAAALYGDDFMSGFSLSDCPAFDEWQFFRREDLRGTAMRLLEAITDRLIQSGQDAEAIPHARRAIALDPLHEPAQRRLMSLHARMGQSAAALRIYQAFADLLDSELQAGPEPATKALAQAIRAGHAVADERKDRPPIRYVESNGVHIAY